MNIHSPFTTFTPTHMNFQPAACRELPHSLEVADCWGMRGLGTGRNATVTGIGEFFERRHFYHEIVGGNLRTLCDSLSEDEANSFVSVFQQTGMAQRTDQAIRSHRFLMTEAYRSTDFSTCFIPTACISITAVGAAMDDDLYPLKDTCGCCCHEKPTSALFGALRESIERQMLTRFWLTRHCIERLAVADVLDYLKQSETYELYNTLRRSGHVQIIDITDSDFPGICVLAIYGSDDPNHQVKYCAGMCYSGSLTAAIEKAIVELWQTFRFMQLFYGTAMDIGKVDDPYLRHFLKCNHVRTFRQIGKIIPQAGTRKRGDMLSFDILMESLHEQNISGYFYLAPSLINGQPLYHSKFISTDLYMHMNNSKNINHTNRYSQKFAAMILAERRSIMVPFP